LKETTLKTNIIKPRKRLEVQRCSILAEDEAVWVTIEIKTSSGEKGDITLWNLRVMGWAKNNTIWFNNYS
jgi:hypothetical protein